MLFFYSLKSDLKTALKFRIKFSCILETLLYLLIQHLRLVKIWSIDIRCLVYHHHLWLCMMKKPLAWYGTPVCSAAVTIIACIALQLYTTRSQVAMKVFCFSAEIWWRWNTPHLLAINGCCTIYPLAIWSDLWAVGTFILWPCRWYSNSRDLERVL